METSIIKIGNSRGLRLNKLILEKYQFQDKVELELKDDHIVIRPVQKPRQNWEAAFQEMHEAGDDELLIDDMFEDDIWD
ncbi:AbrB/MazE/SpoVT family DNA-binding domain-containing protein [Tunicatimonas pelagia]|uniref:AbrB/MazE/SpoVT family DNA-binding domain-containing protein n=1 Tax=Tunicatimonas pelagia TaxID=931531 RepID=UPI0026669F0A|nr:AbrB/MazE/SpoVT family DNA-binding domain-containing protein [Tunicatimonas pelagia]WKN46186.1 AbrB/MazE/SpoVT family DNA-binding domain-containing protein [Tunicatimonas pelagia]